MGRVEGGNEGRLKEEVKETKCMDIKRHGGPRRQTLTWYSTLSGVIRGLDDGVVPVLA